MKPFDTSTEAWEIQKQIYKKMSPTQKMRISFDLTAFSRQLLEQGIRQANPSYSEEQIKREVIRRWLHNARQNNS